ncbi:Carboxylesterase type B [Candidatus Sulfotelmatomonas gaucii]|uniref:Carboxylic ester hydrolase n=1 Tax=Candidatus Sulfuritelmatomonas gaucii TaxID=2043161 RepID=A0A2N9LC71_9BACT|nr:Carboxylesterase type B [Candidatus Sulfotelmatomonas gaucii]
MQPINRRTVLRYSGIAAASLTLHKSFLAFADAQSSPTETSIARTEYGKISGTVEDGINVFRSVPYGADIAPVRFQAPLPPTPWTDVKACDTFTTRAPQLTVLRGLEGVTSAPSLGAAGMTPVGSRPRVAPEAGIQSEDCLHLNVFTPGLRDRRKRPVLVYFHGGAYNNGSVNSPLYDGKRLCHRGDVVVVTVNHRLNAFGFLYLAAIDPKQYPDSGNVSMLDLVLALKWVRNNIAEFGGDPSRVLIFGQSGGGAKCATLMAMPAGHGLFHRVMTMSGQQVMGASIEIASKRTEVMLDKLGITKANLADLKTMPWEKIQAAAAATSSDWLPVVDHVVLPRDPFTPDAPPLSAHVPMILGNTHDETAVPSRGTLTWEDAPTALHNAVAIYLGPYTAEEVIAKYRTIYPDKSPIDIVVAAATAFRAWPGQVMEAERRASNPQSQPLTWVYQMNWHRNAPGARAMHTIDIPFMFDNLDAAPGQIGTAPEDLAAAQPLADAMSGMLIHYAATGNPNHPGLPVWPAYDLNGRNTMIWDNPPHIEKDPRGEERRYAAGSPYRQPGTY